MFYLQQHIILIGFMGSGKTRLGKKLAKELNYPFLDTDQFIENQAKCSIAEIFELYGEDHFRKLETNLLEILESLPPSIIATGGGLPCSEYNIRKLRSMGTLIYLHRPAKELAQRLSNDKGKRPIIATLSSIELHDFVNQKLANRAFFYNMADLRIERNDQKPKALVQALIDMRVVKIES